MMYKAFIIPSLIILFSACAEKDEVQKVNNTIPLTKENIENHFVVPEVPKEMIFAGEHISFKDIDLRERLDNELVINNFWHSYTILMMKRSNRWLPLMKEIFKAEGVPEDLV